MYATPDTLKIAAQADSGDPTIYNNYAKTVLNAKQDAFNALSGVTYPKTITSDNLKDQITPINIPNATIPTVGAGIIGSVQPTTIDTSGIDKANANVASVQDYVQGLVTEKSNIQQNAANSQEQLAITEQNKTLTNINTEIENAQVAYRAQQDKINAQTGVPQFVLDQQLASAETASSHKLADLAIRQSAANTNIVTLQNALDSKIKLQTDPIDNEIAYYKDFGIQNAQYLTQQEKDKLNLIISERDKAKTEIATNEKAKSDILLEAAKNGVKLPDYVVNSINNAKTGAEAASILAQNGISLQNPQDVAYKQAQIDKIRNDIVNNGNLTSSTANTSIDNDVKAILEGRNTAYNIRQTMGRTNATYMQELRDKITTIDPNFDFVASDAGGKSVSSSYIQRATAAINSVLPNIDHIVQLSNDVQRIGVKGVDNILQKTATQFGDKKVSNFHEAQKLIADEIGVALGAGTVSDMKLQLGFDVTDPTVSQEVFASNMGIVKTFIQNRLNGLNSLRYSSSTTNQNNNDPLDLGISNNPLGI